MAYAFSGIFANGGREALVELRRERPGATRMINEPFRGFGIAFATEEEFPPPENPDASPLVPWSRRHPDVTFVYLWVQCHHGQCEQAGFVFRDGDVLHRESSAIETEADSPLKRLLQYLDIEIECGYFEPLTRDYFGHRR